MYNWVARSRFILLNTALIQKIVFVRIKNTMSSLCFSSKPTVKRKGSIDSVLKITTHTGGHSFEF